MKLTFLCVKKCSTLGNFMSQMASPCWVPLTPSLPSAPTSGKHLGESGNLVRTQYFTCQCQYWAAHISPAAAQPCLTAATLTDHVWAPETHTMLYVNYVSIKKSPYASLNLLFPFVLWSPLKSSGCLGPALTVIVQATGAKGGNPHAGVDSLSAISQVQDLFQARGSLKHSCSCLSLGWVLAGHACSRHSRPSHLSEGPLFFSLSVRLKYVV